MLVVCLHRAPSYPRQSRLCMTDQRSPSPRSETLNALRSSCAFGYAQVVYRGPRCNHACCTTLPHDSATPAPDQLDQEPVGDARHPCRESFAHIRTSVDNPKVAMRIIYARCW